MSTTKTMNSLSALDGGNRIRGAAAHSGIASIAHGYYA